MIPARLVLLAGLAGCAVAPRPEPGLSQAVAVVRADPGAALSTMQSIGERIGGARFVPGNHVRLLINGPAAFAALADAIGHARTRIDMETYEFDAQAGSAFGDALLAAHAGGVAVHLIYDGWGTLNTPSSLFDRLRQGGIQTVDYNPLEPGISLPFDINRRDHRKLFVSDDATVVTGGVNISKVYVNPPGQRSADPDDDAWRDTDIEIVGPVAAEFERDFLKTWDHHGGAPIAPPPPPVPPFADGVRVQALDGAPNGGRPLIYRTLLAVIALARKSVHLTTGFFVPTPDLLHALQAAARRGVDVQLIVPGRSTSEASVEAGRASYADLLASGVGVHEFRGRILHAKTAVIDGAWTAIGSSNLDWRSTVWNNEIDAIVISPGLGAEMEAVFTADLAASHTITRVAWSRRGLGERLHEVAATLVGSLL